MQITLNSRVRNWNRIFLISFIILFGGCLSRKFINDTNKYPGQLAKKYYSLSKSSPSYSDLIDTTSVYLFSAFRTFNGEPEIYKVYRFMRFSGEGTVFMSGSYFEPIPGREIDEMPIGEFCRYKLEGKELIIEDYQYRLRKFKMLHADIKSDSIQFTWYKLRTFGGAKDKIEDEIYIKQKADFKSRVIFPN